MANVNTQSLGGFSATGLPGLKSLNAQAASGAGTAFVLGSPIKNASVQILTTGSPASFSVSLQGSLDGVTWVSIGSAITTAGLTLFANALVPYMRLNLTAISGGTNPTLTGWIGGGDFVESSGATLLVVAPASATAGTLIVFTVTADNADGSTNTGYTGTVSFTSTDANPSTVLPAPSTLAAGVGVFSATLTTAGVQTITGGDGAATGTSGAITVAPSVASHFFITTPPALTTDVAAPANVNFTITARDKYNNTATGYTGTVGFTSGDLIATLPANSTLAAGVGAFSATLGQAGNQIITGTDQTTSSITGATGNVNVTGLVMTVWDSISNSSWSGLQTIFRYFSIDGTNWTWAPSNLNIGYTPQVVRDYVKRYYTGTDGIVREYVLSDNYQFNGTSGNVPFGIFYSNNGMNYQKVGTGIIDFTGCVPDGVGGHTGVFAIAFDPKLYQDYDNTLYLACVGTLTGNGNLISYLFPVTALTPSGITIGAGRLVTVNSLPGAVASASDIYIERYPFNAGGSWFLWLLNGSGPQYLFKSDGTAAGGAPYGNYVILANSATGITFGYGGNISTVTPFHMNKGGVPYHRFYWDKEAGIVSVDQLAGAGDLYSGATASGSYAFGGTVSNSTPQLTSPSFSGHGARSPSPQYESGNPTAAASGTAIIMTGSNATQGTGALYTVTAYNLNNTVNTAYAGLIHWTSGDTAIIVPADTGLTAGVGVFSVTFRTAGTQALTATDSVVTGCSYAFSFITVTADLATKFVVVAPANATSAVAITFTVTAEDAVGSVIAGYSGTVAFTSTDGSAVLPANSVLVSGIGVFSATLKTAATQTITATDSGASTLNGHTGGIAVVAQALNHLAITNLSTNIVGNNLVFTVTAQDVSNNTVTGYTGTVDFACTDADASTVLPASATLVNGVGIFSATLTIQAVQTLTATDHVTSSVTGHSPGITVSIPTPTCILDVHTSAYQDSALTTLANANTNTVKGVKDSSGTFHYTGTTTVGSIATSSNGFRELTHSGGHVLIPSTGSSITSAGSIVSTVPGTVGSVLAVLRPDFTADFKNLFNDAFWAFSYRHVSTTIGAISLQGYGAEQAYAYTDDSKLHVFGSIWTNASAGAANIESWLDAVRQAGPGAGSGSNTYPNGNLINQIGGVNPNFFGQSWQLIEVWSGGITARQMYSEHKRCISKYALPATT